MSSNRILGLGAVIALFIGFMALFYTNLQTREQISQTNKQVQSVSGQQKKTETQIDMLEDNYNSDDVKAKTALTKFSVAYYTYKDQQSYIERLGKVNMLLALTDDNKNSLFDNGLDSSGGSKIDNLGLQSQYVKSTSYVNEKDNGTVEILSNVVVKTQSATQKSTSTLVLVQGLYDIQRQQLTSINIYSLN